MGEYIVKQGDTLWDIAQANNTTVDNLVKLNGISNPDLIQIGQVLKLSADAGSTGTSTGSTGAGSSKTEPSPTFSYADYAESDTVKNAGTNAANAADAVKNYGEFSYGNQATLDDVINKILNREKFSYDLNGDALYQQYKDKYMQQGKIAMQDTMGQAAAMTGGYGNSYAVTAGNQAYQAHLENLNDVIPELYQMAYDRYNQEGQDMYNQYSLLSDDRATQYGEWQDGYNRAVADRDYYQGVYDSERSYDYGKWQDGRDFAYGQHRDSIADDQWQATFDEGIRQYDEQFAYQKDRDKIADEQWQKQYDAVYGKTDSGNDNNSVTDGGNDTVVSKPNYDNGGYSSDVVKKAQAFVGAGQDGMWGSNSAAAAKAKGYNSLADVVKAMGGGGNTYDTAAVANFKSKIYPESHHDAIARQMYGPYKAYVAIQIAKDTSLGENEKIALIQQYGITEGDLKYARDKGYDI